MIKRPPGWVTAACRLLGVLGAAAAITMVAGPLPSPAAGGTCGPGRSSESAFVAFFDPGSIGANAEPPVSNPSARFDYLAFVGECQSSTDARMLLALAILVLAFVVAFGIPSLVGQLLGRRHKRQAAEDQSSNAPGTAEPYQWASGEAWGARGPPAGGLPVSSV